MSTNKRIQVSELDYNQIRENLKTFMRGQSHFSDYNFEGSALSTLIDLLAYNTHYNALYTNLAVNEMFLDSASKRSSVVSIANNYAYTPVSSKSSQAILNVTVNQPNATAQLKYIPKLSSFSTTYNSIPYVFYTLEDYIAERNGNIYSFPIVKVYEGTPQTFVFICTELNQKFVLPHVDIDTSTLTITVQSTGEQPDYEKYTLASDIISLGPTDKVYYLKELEDSTYQLSFGANGLGLPIEIGNIITIQYLISSKDVANGASMFTYTGEGVGGIVSCSTTSSAFGGKEKETVDQIKYNVTRSYYNQNRAVTPNDYSSIITRLYPNIDSVSVWGGENNNPPQYGKVFISIKPMDEPYLTPSEKSYIKETILKSRNVVSVTPEIIDPSYIDLAINTTVYYNKNKTTRSAAQLTAAVTNTIIDYNDTYLQKFDGVFRMSKFSSAIDATDQSIQSNITTFKAYCEVIPKYNVYSEYKLNLVNPIYSAGVSEEAFSSSGFYIDSTDIVYYLDDDGIGNIRLYTIIEGTGDKSIKNASIGTIDYSNGYIYVKGLTIFNIVDANFYFIIKTQSYDVASIRNQIVNIPESRITVSVIEDLQSSGTYAGGTNYKFTSSRN